ncbi:MAG: PP2C family protein-serine/threonine phosphatase [Thermoanaerobaculia bacterium]
MRRFRNQKQTIATVIMTSPVKRYAPYGVCVLGLAVLAALMPVYRAAQPKNVSITRGEARRIADAEARRLGIPVDRAWSNEVWRDSALLDKELQNDPDRRRRAADDPVIGPRLGAYRIRYYRRGLEKFPPYGHISVRGDGSVIEARLQKRAEEPGGQPTEESLRPKADAFVRSRTFPGAPNPLFESARPTVTRSRTDWIFRYRVPSTFPTGKVVPYLWVAFNGNDFGGWELAEEYADGSLYRGDDNGELFATFLKFGVMYALLLIFLLLFLRRYHAGEVGVGTSTFLFALTLFLMIVFDLIIGSAASEGTGFGFADAQRTAWAVTGFKMLFVDLPFAVLVFLGWAIGESAARERWGDRLASFDAILRRDGVNATVGRSVGRGLLMGPAVAASAFLIGTIPILARLAHPTIGGGSELTLYLGGPIANVLGAATDAIAASVTGIFILATASRRRLLIPGILAVAALGAIGAVCEVPIDPYVLRLVFGFGGMLAGIGVFLAYDLLATVFALFFGALLTCMLPLFTVARGDLYQQMLLTAGIPLLAAAIFAIVAVMSKREIVYQYEDLAPHVKRIIERERVKAEIDAANRIQAALLPLEAPHMAGASVASHYRAATEIGGDYFDFLPQQSGEIGIAFGDVSGHGLTSGIVMAMAKAALLVQVDYDSSPRAVLDVLNDIVIRTAPRRILMTFFFGLLDPHAQTLRFSSAGHLDPYVYRAADKRVEPLSSWGFPLGVRRREPFREHGVTFAVGDKLILYSDGLIEAIDDDGEPFGFVRFEQAVLENGHRSADDIKKALLQSVRKFTRNRPPEDDQTLVVVSFDEVGAARLTPRVAVAGLSDAVN